MPKRVVILGAGLAGLSCGFELAKNGFDVTILEKDSEIGALALIWTITRLERPRRKKL